MYYTVLTSWFLKSIKLFQNNYVYVTLTYSPIFIKGDGRNIIHNVYFIDMNTNIVNSIDKSIN